MQIKYVYTFQLGLKYIHQQSFLTHLCRVGGYVCEVLREIGESELWERSFAFWFANESELIFSAQWVEFAVVRYVLLPRCIVRYV